MSDLVIDVSRLIGRRLRRRLPTGIDRVGLAYVRHYRHRARAALVIGSRAFVVSRQASQRIFEQLLLPVDHPVMGAVIDGALRTSLRGDARGSWFLNTGHTGLHRAGYGAMVASLGARPLYLIHDLIPLTHPQFCRAPEARLHARRMATALHSGTALACNSQATLDALTEFAERTRVTMPPAAVALLGSDGIDASARTLARSKRPLDRPYFVMLGTIEPRKNHTLMLQLWQRLVRNLGESAPMLVVIGQQGWECEHVLRLLARTPELQEHVLHLNHCSDVAVRGWLAHAQALLFPSFIEGFGLPVLEALELGVPVIAADLPVYREFARDLPEYLDPLDAAGWLAAIAAYSDSGDRRRQRRVEALDAFSGPSWAEHFARIDDLMERVDRRSVQQGLPRPRTEAAW